MAKNDNKAITDVRIESSKPEYLAALEEVAERVLHMWGSQARRAAANLAPVDTGLLRNSITFAVAGEETEISTYKAEHGDGSGSYSGMAPEDDGGKKRTVYIGSNVEYAMAQEVGNFHDGSHAYLRPAVDENRDYFRSILEGELKKAMQNDNG